VEDIYVYIFALVDKYFINRLNLLTEINVLLEIFNSIMMDLDMDCLTNSSKFLQTD